MQHTHPYSFLWRFPLPFRRRLTPHFVPLLSALARAILFSSAVKGHRRMRTGNIFNFARRGFSCLIQLQLKQRTRRRTRVAGILKRLKAGVSIVIMSEESCPGSIVGPRSRKVNYFLLSRYIGGAVSTPFAFNYPYCFFMKSMLSNLTDRVMIYLFF